MLQLQASCVWIHHLRLPRKAAFELQPSSVDLRLHPRMQENYSNNDDHCSYNNNSNKLLISTNKQ